MASRSSSPIAIVAIGSTPSFRDGAKPVVGGTELVMGTIALMMVRVLSGEWRLHQLVR